MRHAHDKSHYSDIRKAIVITAERLFAIHGFENTTIRTIAEEAAVNIAAVNYYFHSKENLYREIFKQRIQQLETILAVLHVSLANSEEENYCLFMDTLLIFSDEHGYFMDLIFREISAFHLSKCRMLLFSFLKKTIATFTAMESKTGKLAALNSKDKFAFYFQLFCSVHPLLRDSGKLEVVLGIHSSNEFQSIAQRIKNHAATHAAKIYGAWH